MSDWQHDVQAAIDAILAAGRRPSVRNVRETIAAGGTFTAPSFRDLSPLVSHWREQHRQGRAVLQLVATYHALDAEERDSFQEICGLRLRPVAERLDDLAATYQDADDVDLDRLQSELGG